MLPCAIMVTRFNSYQPFASYLSYPTTCLHSIPAQKTTSKRCCRKVCVLFAWRLRLSRSCEPGLKIRLSVSVREVFIASQACGLYLHCRKTGSNPRPSTHECRRSPNSSHFSGNKLKRDSGTNDEMKGRPRAKIFGSRIPNLVDSRTCQLIESNAHI